MMFVGDVSDLPTVAAATAGVDAVPLAPRARCCHCCNSDCTLLSPRVHARERPRGRQVARSISYLSLILQF